MGHVPSRPALRVWISCRYLCLYCHEDMAKDLEVCKDIERCENVRGGSGFPPKREGRYT